LSAAEGNLCGPLDVADTLSYVSTARLSDDQIDASLSGAVSTLGSSMARSLEHVPGHKGVLLGPDIAIKAQSAEHERRETFEWFDELRERARIPAPALRTTGLVHIGDKERWWAIHDRARGVHAGMGVEHAARQQSLAECLRSFHTRGVLSAQRLDKPGALGVYLGTVRSVEPGTYLVLARLFDERCRGATMAPVHGDVATTHNTLYDGPQLTAILDPGAVHVAPLELDRPARIPLLCSMHMERKVSTRTFLTACSPSCFVGT
jgi:aminoglycoside 3'-phosphotransferase-2